MSKTFSQQLVDTAQKEGKIPPPFLQLGEKLEGGGVRSTGPHRVVFLNDKGGSGTDMITGQVREEVHYLFKENGVIKRYAVPKFMKGTDELNYFVVRMADYQHGDEIVLEMKKKGIKNYIDISRAEPSIDEAEPTQEKKVAPTIEGDEIDMTDQYVDENL